MASRYSLFRRAARWSLALFFWLGLAGLCARAGWSAPPSDLEIPAGATETQPTEIFTPKEPVTLKINIPAARLDLYVNGKMAKRYRIAVGMPKYPTPIRDLNISYIIWNPWWLPPDSEWAKDAEKTPPGPGNPLGPVKMLMEDGIRIHGTNAPGSIGRSASHACMRMKSAEAKELAWEIQQRYSEKNDPLLLDTYKKNSRSSYWVKLGQEVPVSIEYKLVERDGDQFQIHPDRYGRGGLQEELEAALGANSGIVIDKEFLKRLNKKRVKGTLEITLQELKDLQAPPVAAPGPLNSSSAGALTVQPAPSVKSMSNSPVALTSGSNNISRPLPPSGLLALPK